MQRLNLMMSLLVSTQFLPHCNIYIFLFLSFIRYLSWFGYFSTGKKANVDNVSGDLSKCETCGKLGNFGKKKRRFCNPNCAKNKKVGPSAVEVNGTVSKVLSK